MAVATLQIVENESGLWGPVMLEFHDTVYYCIVSFTTVGYGDLAPKSVAGRLIVIVMLSWSFITVRGAVSCTRAGWLSS